MENSKEVLVSSKKKKKLGQTLAKYFQVPITRILNPWLHIRIPWEAFKNPDSEGETQASIFLKYPR